MLVIPSIHPAVVFHAGKPITDCIASDLGKAWRIANYGRNLTEHIIYVTPGNPIGIQTAFEYAIGYLKHWTEVGATVGVDVETSGLEYFNCKLYSIAIAEASSSVAISFALMNFHTLPFEMETALIAWLRHLLACPYVTKVYHNSPFDRAVLARKGFKLEGKTLDTMAMHHLIQPDIPHDLGWVGHTYLDVEPWKLNHQSGKMANTKDPIELLIYNAKDALYTVKMVEPLIKDIYSRGMNSELIQWQMAFADLATDMELAGLPVNMERRREMGNELQHEMIEDLLFMRKFLDWPDFNPMSQAHRIEAIYSKKYAGGQWGLGLTPTRFTEKTQAPSTSYKCLIDYLEHPFIRHLANYVESRHTYSTMFSETIVKGMKNGKKKIKMGAYQKAMYHDRLYAKWNPVSQVGSRFGSNPNVQNIKKKYREFIEAINGRCFVAADKDQLELRLVAVKAGVRELLSEMSRLGGDPHILACRNTFPDFDANPKDMQDTLRTIEKNVVYASVYLAGVLTVWRTIRERKQLDPAIRAMMTQALVQHVHSAYFGRYIEIPRMHHEAMRQVKRNGHLQIDPFNRRRYYPVQPPPMNEVANWPTQTRGSDYVGREMVLIQDELKHRYHGEASVCLHGHDQVVVECPVGIAGEVRDLINKIFGNTFVDGPAGPVYLTAKAKIGKTLRCVSCKGHQKDCHQKYCSFGG